MELIHFDAETEGDLNEELKKRKIDFVDVVSVETRKLNSAMNEGSANFVEEGVIFRVWYWYRSDLIT